MNKKIFASLIVLPYALLFCWVITLYIQSASGRDVRLAISGYDPRDILSGHYIQFTIDWDKVNCSQFEDNKCPVHDFCRTNGKISGCRFYVPSENAKQLDQIFNRNTQDNIFEVIFSYRKGQAPIAKQLLINGRDWRDSIKD